MVAAQLPRKFPCSLDPSPTSSSEASGGAGKSADRQLGAFSNRIVGPHPQMQGLALWVVDMHSRMNPWHKVLRQQRHLQSNWGVGRTDNGLRSTLFKPYFVHI